MALSPMMQQYNKIKEQYSDCLLMFRLGDFYELFFDDAITASRVLELTLTGRNCGLEERAPMCGVPHHAVDSYLNKLVQSGYKVAICEQMEDPSEAKGIVQRDVIRVVTPGTIDVDSSTGNDNIYIASLSYSAESAGIAFADISTGELVCTEIPVVNGMDAVYAEIGKYSPKELIIQEEYKDAISEMLQAYQINVFLNPLDRSYYKLSSCSEAVQSQFKVNSLLSLGLDAKDEATKAVGSVLMYLIDTQKQAPSQILKLEIKNINNTMQLDRSAMRNLELLETLYDHQLNGSLLGVLNHTRTAMGGRLLKSWIKEPLKDADEINLRLSAVDELMNKSLVANNISNSLKHVYDFQRLTARIASSRANARDMIALKQTLGELPNIIDQLEYLDSDICNEIRQQIGSFDSLYHMIDRAIVPEPPYLITEGGIIKAGYSDELDALKESIKEAKQWIAGLESSERERTGIKTIKVGYNKVFGYYIDVSKGMIDKVPDDYIRKQTLVNNERYITPELKEKESLVLSAENKINKIEYEVFRKLRESAIPYLDALQRASNAIAALDVLICFSKVARDNNYVKPVIDNSAIIDIRNGRHPTVEKLIGSGMFVSNNTYMDNDKRSMLIITGPNMAGKSTYMRQTAIIVLMAQMGCFVPAESARIGVVDRVFTRIGASDNLAHGQSTFFIEMSELANILRNANSRSLVILDEIGRGTSTWDGLSIAWATVEYLCRDNAHIRTMFATHYHELTELSSMYSTIHNLSVAVAEDNNNVIFLHNIVDGPASKSYGIHVAKIAGVPEEIRRNARIKLHELEALKPESAREGEQLSLFNIAYDSLSIRETDNEEKISALDDYKPLLRRLSGIDINNMTPIDAMLELHSLIDELGSIGGSIDD